MYIILFNGRSFPDEQLNDWGHDGPIFHTEESVVMTYGCEIRMTDDHTLYIRDDCVYYDGSWFGDWEFCEDSQWRRDYAENTHWQSRIREFVQVRADPPTGVSRKERPPRRRFEQRPGRMVRLRK